MLVTGKKTKSRLENILEDLVEAILDLKKNETAINIAAPDIVFPEQKPPTIVMPKMPEQKVVIVNTPEQSKPIGVRCKIVRGNYRDIEYIDIVPIPDK